MSILHGPYDILVLASAFINIVAIAVAGRKTRNPLNLFSFVSGGFFLAAVFYLLAPMPLETLWLPFVTLQTALFIVVVALAILVMNLFLRSPKRPLQGFVVERFATIHPHVVFFAVCGMVFLLTVMLWAKNGWRPPILLLSENYGRGTTTSYRDHDIPFVTPVAIGLARYPMLFIAFSLAIFPGPVRTHFQQNRVLYGCAVLVTLLAYSSGRRNVLFWPMLWFLFAFTYRQRPTWKMVRKGILVLSGFVIFFSYLGNLRRGGIFEASNLDFMKANHRLPIPVVDEVYAQLGRYTQVIYNNMNALFSDPPRKRYGLVLLSEIVPNRLLPAKIRRLMPNVDSMDYMADLNLTVWRGQTFRTAFSDYVIDFGVWGSGVFGCSLYGVMVWLYNRKERRPFYFVLFMVFVPGLVFMPYLNVFTGSVTLSCLAFAVLGIQVKALRPSVTSGRSLSLAKR